MTKYCNKIYNVVLWINLFPLVENFCAQSNPYFHPQRHNNTEGRSSAVKHKYDVNGYYTWMQILRPLLLIYGGGAAGDSAAPFPFTQVFLAGPYVGNRGGRGGGRLSPGKTEKAGRRNMAQDSTMIRTLFRIRLANAKRHLFKHFFGGNIRVHCQIQCQA